MNKACFLFPFVVLAVGCININVYEGGTGGGGAMGLGASRGGSAGSSADCGPVLPKATDSITLRGNLDQTAMSVLWDAVHPKETSNFTTSLTVYDSLGKAIQLDLYFGKHDALNTVAEDSGDWTYHLMTDGMNLAFQSDGISPTIPGTDTEIASGVLRFDSAGRLVSNTTTNQGFYPTRARSPQALTFNFGTGTQMGGKGLDGLTQYAATSAITFVDQSGWSSSICP